MKITNVMTVRQAVIVACSAAATAVLLYLFGPIVAGGLILMACILGLYAAVAQWAPEIVDDTKTTLHVKR
jgi:hypothetical protein